MTLILLTVGRLFIDTTDPMITLSSGGARGVARVPSATANPFNIIGWIQEWFHPPIWPYWISHFLENWLCFRVLAAVKSIKWLSGRDKKAWLNNSRARYTKLSKAAVQIANDGSVIFSKWLSDCRYICESYRAPTRSFTGCMWSVCFDWWKVSRWVRENDLTLQITAWTLHVMFPSSDSPLVCIVMLRHMLRW